MKGICLQKSGHFQSVPQTFRKEGLDERDCPLEGPRIPKLPLEGLCLGGREWKVSNDLSVLDFCAEQ